jgi:hypothetical protein
MRRKNWNYYAKNHESWWYKRDECQNKRRNKRNHGERWVRSLSVDKFLNESWIWLYERALGAWMRERRKAFVTKSRDWNKAPALKCKEKFKCLNNSEIECEPNNAGPTITNNTYLSTTRYHVTFDFYVILTRVDFEHLWFPHVSIS